MKLKEGTINNPKLLNIDYYWKYIKIYTDDIDFKKITKKSIINFISNRINEKPFLKNMEFNEKIPYWQYATNYIYFKKYISNDPKDINYYRIAKGCHWMQKSILYLMNKLDSTQEWIILYGNYHSCIINKNRTIVVDLFAKPYKYNTALESLEAVEKKIFNICFN